MGCGLPVQMGVPESGGVLESVAGEAVRADVARPDRRDLHREGRADLDADAPERQRQDVRVCVRLYVRLPALDSARYPSIERSGASASTTSNGSGPSRATYVASAAISAASPSARRK